MTSDVINSSTCINANWKNVEGDKLAMIVFWYPPAPAISVILVTLGLNMFWRKSFVLLRDIPIVVLFEMLAMAIYQRGHNRFMCQQYFGPGLLGFYVILWKWISKVLS